MVYYIITKKGCCVQKRDENYTNEVIHKAKNAEDKNQKVGNK